MRCPDCGGDDLKVTDSRENVESVRRRRECNDCGRRFTTYERLEQFTCPRCESVESRVVAIEQLKSGVRRVRECLNCGNRFSTSERPDMDKLLVVKRNGQREEFNRTKIFEGIRLACLNRPVSARQMEAVVDTISSSLLESGLSEIAARRIGDMAMEELRRLDDDDLHISNEILTGPDERVPLFQIVSSHEAGGDVWVAYNNFARGGKKPQLRCTDQMAVLAQLQSSARFAAGQKTAQTVIPDIATKFQDWLSNVVFLDPQPAAMRGYSFATERILTGSGASLSGVLYNLCEEPSVRRELLQFVEALPEQNIGKMDFIETPRSEVMVKLTETFGGRNSGYDATLLSDGTLRVLAIAAAVLSAPEGSLVVIEEIDNGVHPSRAEQLLDRLLRVATRRNLRVLISSHNPALLDALPDDAVPDVVFCYRDPESGTSRLTRLMDIPDYPELVAQGAVGHLMTRGTIERFVKAHPGPRERRRLARSWLSDLRDQVG